MGSESHGNRVGRQWTRGSSPRVFVGSPTYVKKDMGHVTHLDGGLSFSTLSLRSKAVKTLSLVVSCRTLIYTSLMRTTEAFLAYLRRL